jgi:hypothetical protein
VTVEVVDQIDQFPLWTMVMVEEAWPSQDPNRIAGALAVLEKIYPDTLGAKMNKTIAFDWPDFEDYAAQPCPVCEKFHTGADDDDTVLVAEIVEDDDTYYDLEKVPAMQGRCPTCYSPDPMKHPANPNDESVIVCGDPYHDPEAPVHAEVYPMNENSLRQLKYYEGLPR